MSHTLHVVLQVVMALGFLRGTIFGYAPIRKEKP